VVATNVLHATRDIRETLANVRSLLAPRGLLLLCETTTELSWLDITVGLTDGWHRSEDDVRKGRPLMAADGWEKLLAESGFEQVASLPETGSAAEILGQRVFIARNISAGMRAQSKFVSASRHAVARNEEQSAEAAELVELRASPPSRRRELLIGVLRRQIARLLRFDSPDQVSRKRRLTDMGLDSLMAVEFRNRLTSALSLDHPPSATLIFDHPTVDALAEYLDREVLGFGQQAEPPTAEIDNFAVRAEELEHLDDDEVEALLVRRLQTL
jgi:hypothetical protein